PSSTATNPGVVVADSATVQISSGHDVRGGAVVINKSDYPEIANASYYGAMPGTPNGATQPPTANENKMFADPVPYGNAYSSPATTTDGGVASGDVATPTAPAVAGTGAATPPRHEIRSLMYFGDAEVVNAVNRNVASPRQPYVYQHFVAALYCVDALRGNVVWRY